MKKQNLEPGQIYRHYKGNLYKVLGVARHSESLEELVVYECLYENDLGTLWVRPLEMFLETLIVDGKEVLRFSPQQDNSP